MFYSWIIVVDLVVAYKLCFASRSARSEVGGANSFDATRTSSLFVLRFFLNMDYECFRLDGASSEVLLL